MFAREVLAKKIADRLRILADQLKVRTRAGFTDANQSLEDVVGRLFNALFGWNLENLNAEQPNFPGADLGDDIARRAVQVTNREDSAKITETIAAAADHHLGERFGELIIFFLLPRKPGRTASQKDPPGGPTVETWDLADLLIKMKPLLPAALEEGWRVLQEETRQWAEAAPLSSLHQLPTNPALLGFTGREADLEKLRAVRERGGVVLSGMKGMGGIGKTALALVLAHEWAPHFPDAQLFLDGRGTQPNPPDSPALMAQVITAFHPGAKLPDDPHAIRGIYHDLLRGKKVLLLLDNAPGAMQVRQIIPPAGCALLVTSRFSFTLGNVPPHELGRLPAPEAIALLRQFHPGLTDDDAAALAKLCAGLPLALRLAGSRLALDGEHPDVAGYLRALRSGRLAALDPEAEGAGEATISETLRLSEATLSEPERAAWRKLGVFTASFDARAAEAIAWADEGMLRGFIRRSLLEREGPDRYQLHDLAADYARDQLDAATLTALHVAHAGHYTAIGYEAARLYLKGDVVGGLALFDAERVQIEAAHAWLAGRDDEAAARRMIALVDAVVYTGDLRFHPRQRIAWLESQLRAARLTKERQHEGAALGNLGIAHRHLGDAWKAIEYHEQALLVSREIGDRCGEGNALGNLGSAHAALGDARKAIEYHEQTLIITREIGDRRGEGEDLGNLGLAHADLGDARKAIEYHEQALGVMREIGDKRAKGSILGNLGLAHKNLGDARKAIEYYEQYLGIAREIGDRRGEGNALWNFAVALDSLGERAEAIRRAEEALRIYEAIEDPYAAQVRAGLAEWRGAGGSG